MVPDAKLTSAGCHPPGKDVSQHSEADRLRELCSSKGRRYMAQELAVCYPRPFDIQHIEDELSEAWSMAENPLFHKRYHNPLARFHSQSGKHLWRPTVSRSPQEREVRSSRRSVPPVIVSRIVSRTVSVVLAVSPRLLPADL